MDGVCEFMGFTDLCGQRGSALLRSSKVCAMKIFVEVNQGQLLSQLSSSSLNSKHSSIWTSNIPQHYIYQNYEALNSFRIWHWHTFKVIWSLSFHTCAKQFLINFLLLYQRHLSLPFHWIICSMENVSSQFQAHSKSNKPPGWVEIFPLPPFSHQSELFNDYAELKRPRNVLLKLI